MSLTVSLCVFVSQLHIVQTKTLGVPFTLSTTTYTQTPDVLSPSLFDLLYMFQHVKTRLFPLKGSVSLQLQNMPALDPILRKKRMMGKLYILYFLINNVAH